jgi:hypothetical protein
MKLKQLKNVAILTLTILTLDSCVTEKRCRETFPCSNSTEIVTRIKDTTIVTSRTSFDTIFRFKQVDTLFFRDKETRIETKVIRLPGDSIFVESICPSDTIRVEKVVQTIKNVGLLQDESLKKAIKFVAFGAGFLILLLFAGGYFLKSLKNK